MRDPIRDYRMAIRGRGGADSASDSEAQPLVSSCSSTRSFGSLAASGAFESESGAEEPALRPFGGRGQRAAAPALPARQLHLAAELGAEDTRFKALMASGGALLECGGATHNSLVTIFAIWNTVVGTSLLSMSWGIEKTGLFPAVAMNALVAAICLYTIAAILEVEGKHGLATHHFQVPELCRQLIGRWAEAVAKAFSLVVLIGANIVYWILMSNFLYNSVHFFYGALGSGARPTPNQTVLCPREAAANATAAPPAAFDRLWDLYSTVPMLLAVIMFPLLNWRSPTFFTKFNSLGTLSVLYLIVFVAAKAWGWGVHINEWAIEFHLKPTFCALSGMLSLSYFIHNIIVSLMRNNHRQENNNRDLIIAFGLITFTYLFIGGVFYVTFPLAKYCIEDNILNNFDQFDVLAIIARILLLFQLFTVFPLISYMLRNDILACLNAVAKGHRLDQYTYGKVVLLNALILTVCVLFACFLPRIGTLIRYTGALSGMVYIFMLPSLLKLASLRKEGNLTIFNVVFHLFIIFLGVLNLISQFFINV